MDYAKTAKIASSQNQQSNTDYVALVVSALKTDTRKGLISPKGATECPVCLQMIYYANGGDTGCCSTKNCISWG